MRMPAWSHPSLVATVLALGCGPKAGEDGGSGTEGTTDGDLSPSATCDAYLECASVVTPAELGPLLDTYGPEGSCWQSTQEVADQCEIACESGLAQLQMAFPDEAVCSDPVDDGTGTGGGTGDPVTEREVDIILVVDNSGSMGEEQAYLAEGIAGLVDVLDQATPPVDYRIAVTTTDNGNPWCQGTTPEAGAFRATSCLSRPTEFRFEGAVTIDAFDEACANQCTMADLGLSEPWLDVPNATGTPPAQVAETLRCMLPQGINGCGLESQLESMWKAIRRTETPDEASFGFHREGALLAVLLLTDEADCSYDYDWESIFLPDGNRVFWSDPDAPAPSSAVCWNAGVACQGGPVYSSCSAVDRDVDGNPATDPDDAVLYTLDRYVSQLAETGAYIMAIDGVGSDGSVTYADSLDDPQFQSDFGIGPGCESVAGRAVPPVRIHQLVEMTSGPGNERSVCDGGYGSALATFGNGILTRLP